MFRQHQKIRERLLEAVDKLRQKGAVSPDNAMTIEELDSKSWQINQMGLEDV